MARALRKAVLTIPVIAAGLLLSALPAQAASTQVFSGYGASHNPGLAAQAAQNDALDAAHRAGYTDCAVTKKKVVNTGGNFYEADVELTCTA
ncbi:hypothetical protein [Psychromicrobium sp. YIM B11713]|uniref:hypothetical protein n=1 Tax=Psychromicrobium sp. YIM B11713 TaxID=3145233 RepID=UPI00374EE93D